MVKYNYKYKCGVFTGMEKLFMIKLQIPATSANLGAGFDALGLALTYYNFVEMEESDTIDIATLDNIDIPTDEIIEKGTVGIDKTNLNDIIFKRIEN